MSVVNCFRMALLLLFVGSRAATAADPTVAAIAEKPSAAPAPIGDKLAETGLRVAADGKRVCDLWLAKPVPVTKGFRPTLSVKYPFNPGQLVGVLSVADDAEFTDFRGQEIGPGTYSLRYARQPQDGNHLGTSVVEDFLVAIPIADDTTAEPVTDKKKLLKMSSAASGTNHPAIFSLLPVEIPTNSPPALTHEDQRDLWVLETVIDTDDSDHVSLPLQLVVIGHAEG